MTVLRALFALAALLAWGAPAAAPALPLPAINQPAIFEAIDDQCPDCRRTGFSACGTNGIGPGDAFARSLLQGAPRRGYLVGFVMTGEDFRKLARGTPRDALVEGLERRFARARLVVVEDGLARVRVLDQTPRVTVEMPEPLHACIADQGKPWGCCVGAGCQAECCEKSLGSPSVTLQWVDAEVGEEVRYMFRHGLGEATLQRSGSSRPTTYFCLTDRRYVLN